jgi:prolipoprotein diacylglyceryltransferase
VGAVRRLEGRPGNWGGIALGTVAGIWRLRRAGADVPRFLDAAAPSLLVAQAIGRVGNYFNQELYGRPTSLPWGLEIDLEHRPSRYADSATFHPTFLYEIVWNLALAGFLVCWASGAPSALPGSSRCTSPAIAHSGSSRSSCASIRPSTSWACA